MGYTKEDLLRSQKVRDQSDMVKALIKNKVNRIKTIIPGGDNLFEQVGDKNLKTTVYTWLRAKRFFTEFTISLAKDPSKYNLEKIKYYDFPLSKDGAEPWEVMDGGKMTVAGIIADAIREYSFVKIDIDKDGIWIFTDKDGTFSPTKTVTQEDTDSFIEALAELNAELETPLKMDIPVVGEQIPSPEWQPYLEILPKSVQRYGR